MLNFLLFLGQVPGTNLVITFDELVVAVSLALVAALVRAYLKKSRQLMFELTMPKFRAKSTHPKGVTPRASSPLSYLSRRWPITH